jgi:hypothetical protein
VESGEWKLLNNSNIQKYGNSKNSEKKLGFFSIILPDRILLVPVGATNRD